MSFTIVIRSAYFDLLLVYYCVVAVVAVDGVVVLDGCMKGTTGTVRPSFGGVAALLQAEDGNTSIELSMLVVEHNGCNE